MTKRVKRCALYTRKSSEEGLGQDFNSLEAQREACAAYVASQRGEGWQALAVRYDDGGYSGGSMERPALQRLLADVEAGKVDVVLVYKIDRLTRALADFARIVELFDRREVSFVSVTQAFNTTSSMGRLTLNVLLSFAQFEREVTGERIRDKIAASKAKGLWMGGTLPLGYDLPAPGSRALLVNETEAATVRTIFARYLELGSVHEVRRRLLADGICSKRRVTAKGHAVGGQPFSRGALFHLLRNRIYLGTIVHKGTVHPGRHPAIVDHELFHAVQAKLDAHVRRRAGRVGRAVRAPLAGRLFHADGTPLTPTFAYGRHGKLYRYYTAATLQRGLRTGIDEKDVTRRVSASALEARIDHTLRRLLAPRIPEPLPLPTRIELRRATIHILLPLHHHQSVRDHLGEGELVERDIADPSQLRLMVPLGIAQRGGRTTIEPGRPTVKRTDPILVDALRRAHAMIERDDDGLPVLSVAPSSSHRRRLVRLAFLAPDLQAAILTGTQPATLTLAKLMEGEMPLCWCAQRELYGSV